MGIVGVGSGEFRVLAHLRTCEANFVSAGPGVESGLLFHSLMAKHEFAMSGVSKETLEVHTLEPSDL